MRGCGSWVDSAVQAAELPCPEISSSRRRVASSGPAAIWSAISSCSIRRPVRVLGRGFFRRAISRLASRLVAAARRRCRRQRGQVAPVLGLDPSEMQPLGVDTGLGGEVTRLRSMSSGMKLIVVRVTGTAKSSRRASQGAIC